MQQVARVVARLALATLVVVLLALPSTPDSSAQTPNIDGSVAIGAQADGGGNIVVAFDFTNAGDTATISLDSVVLPIEAAGGQCRGLFGQTQQPLTIATDGTVLLTSSTITLPTDGLFRVECQYMPGDACDLIASAAATWPAPLGLVTATALVSPPCPTPVTPDPTDDPDPVTPTPMADYDGTVTIEGQAGDAGTALVAFVFTNLGDPADVSIDSVMLPVEAVATAQCRGLLGRAEQMLTVGPDGSVMLPTSVLPLTTDGVFRVECQYVPGDACDLMASAAATWPAPLGQLTATAPASPPCDTPNTNQARVTGPFMLLDKTPSIQSVPVGSVVEWTLTVHNIGSRRLTRVQIFDQVHPALEVLPRSITDDVEWDEATRTLMFPIGAVPVGQTATVTFATRVHALSHIPNTASAISRQDAWATAESGVFGLAPEPTPTPTPEPQTRQERRAEARAEASEQRAENRAANRALALTGAETSALMVIGITLVAGGVMVTSSVRRRDDD